MPRASSGPGRSIPPRPAPPEEAHEENSARSLARDIEELRATKAEDLAAKRAGEHDKRPALALKIYELTRAIEAARGGHSG